MVDFNGDNLVDILFHGEFFIVFENNGDNTFSRKFIGGPFDPNQFQAVDLNDDGRLEIVINAYFGQVLIENSAEGYSITELLSNGYMEDTFIGDIDQDGDLDILILNEDQLLYWSENLNGKYQKAVWWLIQ